MLASASLSSPSEVNVPELAWKNRMGGILHFFHVNVHGNLSHC